MSEDQNPDPGGSNPNPPFSQTPQDLSDLKDQNEQQLLLINQLKEMLRKEQSSVSQDKVEEYVNTLNKVRAKRSKRRESESSVTSVNTSLNTSGASIDANKKERVNLLRQQLEENKAKLAQRGRSQKGIEEMVSQMQAQFKDSVNVTASVVDVKNLTYNENTPQKELYNILLTKERKITELLTKTQKLEGSILDLQENLKEKDSVIDARTKAITLMTDSLSKKGKSTLDTLDETKEQMRKMQENFVTLEGEMKARQLTLLNDLKIKNFEIAELQEANRLLESEKVELQQKILVGVSSPESDTNITELYDEIQKLKRENLNQSTIVEELNEKLQKMSEEKDKLESQTSQLDIKKEEGQREESEQLNSLKQNLEDVLSSLKSLNQEKERIAEQNSKLMLENSDLLTQIGDLEKKLKEALCVSGSTNTRPESDEIVKLKKQLDESNKNMIKMRATQKGKLKELNKKLDQFRKMNDANALIGQLQNEISKLNEKIAELEDEKGNLQLEIVDSSNSSKDEQSATLKEIEQLKEDLAKAESNLSEKDKIIAILEEEVLSLKEDLKVRSEEEVKVSSQVSSEMSSIYYEEQIELLEQEKKKLNEQIDLLNAEKVDLLQNLEEVKNEKLDLNNKLESYIQENMELIDKLEKLSAEKASSAESIEIVEGLTQQEKIELAAYQKHLNPEDATTESLKCGDEDNIEPAAELNESVLQLSEDTAELLQKIDIFTQERKEVMQKMECLKEQNDTLHIKIKEIENNRDILEETYEQLQNEKEKLEEKNQHLTEKLENLHVEQPQQPIVNEEHGTVTELKQLQLKYEVLLSENEELKRTLKDFDSIMQEKYDLESRLRDAVENNSSLDTKLNSDLDEINNYQLTIEENKEELIKSSEIIAKLKSELEERENDIKELQLNISDLNSVISELQNKESGFENMESELNDLKSDLTKQIEQAGDYEAEIAQNDEVIRKLNEEVLNANRRISELENQLELKDGELEKLSKEISNNDSIIRSLQVDIEEKNKSFKVVSEDIKSKYLRLQEQLENNDGSLQHQVTELSSKNKEQLEKMKKIAANLKKKTQAYNELEDQYRSEKQRWEQEAQYKDQSIANLQERLKSLLEDSNVRESNLRAEIEELKDEIQTLQQTNADQQKYIQDLKNKQEKLVETNLQQEMSASLHEEVDYANKFVPDDKIRELELLVETSETDLSNFKDRVDKLEEDIRRLEKAKSELEQDNLNLSEKLNLASSTIDEKLAMQHQLELRLSEVTANDEALLKKLEETQAEHADLLKKSKDHEELIKKLKIKLKKSQDKVNELKSSHEGLQVLEAANEALRKQITTLEEHQRHIQNENDSLQRKNVSDYEKIETDYQVQLDALSKVKNELTVENEKLIEKIKEVEDREQEAVTELAEVKKKLEEVEESKVEEIRVLLEDLEAANLRVQQLNERLRDASLQIDQANQQLHDSDRKSEYLEHQLQELSTDNSELVSTLNETNEKLQKSATDLEQSRGAVQELRLQVEALEFAKASLEASCESYQKLEDTVGFEPPPTSLEGQSSPEQNLSLVIPQSVSELDTLQSELDRTKAELQSALQELASLKEEVSKLSQKNEPEEAVQRQDAVPIFSAFAQPGGSENWFQSQFEIQQVQQEKEPALSPVIEEGRESLLKKIKALEFLLYNMDKEKEIALDQCTEMINELTQLIYNKADQPSLDLESQIVPVTATKALATDTKSLQSIEFAATSAISGEQPIPVVEETIEPKHAYVCFGDEQPAVSAANQESLEKQVISEQEIANEPALQQLEYQQVTPSLGEQQLPVVEPLAQPKQAYLCYSKEDKPQSLEAFEENDDGWAWGPEEARLEAEHLSTVESTPQVRNLLLEVQQLKDNIRVFQVEREHHLEEIKQLQVKSGKLIKKYKELKTKYEGQAIKKPEEDFFDLNETIQDELKAQIQQLEKKLKEVLAEHEKEKLEKSNLLKRVDVLVAANDRLTEMKEIQDSEVLRWQRKYEQAAEKLQEYDWGSDGFGEPKRVTTVSSSEDQSAKIKELEDTIKDLSLDNEELQALLEENQQKRLQLEKKKSVQDAEVELQNINENLYKQLEEIRRKLAEEVSEKEELVQQKQVLEKSLMESKGISNQAICSELEEARLKLSQVQSEKSGLEEEKFALEKSLRDAEYAVSELQKRISNTENDFKEKETVYSTQQQLVEQIRQELNDKSVELAELRSQFEAQLDDKENIINNLNQRVEQLQSQEPNMKLLEDSLHLKCEEISNLTREKKQKDDEYDKVIQEIAEKTKEIERLMLERRDYETTVQELSQQIRTLSAENQTLNNQLNVHGNTELEYEQLKSQLTENQAEIDRLTIEINSKESEFQHRISTLTNELNESWQIQVDQRGADVAESWKLHLEMVEKDFTSVQQKMQNDIQELEEKCNILVKENNELRKSVDQEIRNEVDKMSALHQQITTLQQTVNSLNQSIQEKDKLIEEIEKKLSEYFTLEQQYQSLKADSEEKERKLAGVNVIIETTQKQFDEKRAVVEELVTILEKQALAPVSYEKDDILRELKRQLGNSQEIATLQQLVQELEDKLTRVTGEKSREINGLNQIIEDLEKEVGMMHMKEAEIVRLTADLNQTQEQANQLRQEIGLLQQQNSVSDAELAKLRQEHSNCLLKLENHTKKIQEQEEVRLSLEQSLLERNQQVSELNSKLRSLQDEARNDSNKEIETLNGALVKAKEECLTLQNSLSECKKQLAETEENLLLRSQELQLANENIVQWQHSQTYYTEEISRLTTLLEEREREYNNSLELLKNNQLTELQRHYDELLSNKDLDLNTLQAQIQELIHANQSYAERLSQEMSAKQLVEQQLNEQTQLVDEDTKQLEELKLIIEDQVVKIEQLKKELFDKSNQYDSLIAEMDVGRLPVTRQPLSATTVDPLVSAQKRSYDDEDLSEPVSRAELDLALYMLHQRDVRCEELTVELTQLLEERDTLQLRLSNAIREKEELRRSAAEQSATSAALSNNPEVLQGVSSPAQTNPELHKHLPADNSDLATKLSELKNVGYKKDKTFVDEQEARRHQQLAIMQQHINEASKLPPEAAAKLVDATYTLSRDVQSPSKVLLNWLWGKNPPKANDS